MSFRLHAYMNSMAESLSRSAEKLAQSAMRDFQAENWVSFAVSSGTALEHLTKAFLASIHPSLTVEGFESLLHAAQHADYANVPPSRLKTIGLSMALERCGKLVPEFDLQRPQLRPLVDARNSAVHLGALDEQHLRAMLPPFVKATHSLLIAMQVDVGAFWGDFMGPAEAAVTESAKEADVYVAAAVAAAMDRFKTSFDDSPDSKDHIRALEESYAPEKYEQQLDQCPACKHQALLTGRVYSTWIPDVAATDELDDLPAAEFSLEVDFRPMRLSCRICGLRLDTPEYLEKAGFAPSWLLEDVDEEDFLEELERDKWWGWEDL